MHTSQKITIRGINFLLATFAIFTIISVNNHVSATSTPPSDNMMKSKLENTLKSITSNVSSSIQDNMDKVLSDTMGIVIDRSMSQLNNSTILENSDAPNTVNYFQPIESLNDQNHR